LKVIDLNDEHKELYFVCLEDWNVETAEAGDHKRIWYDAMKEKGLRVKLALDDSGNIGGMIQYMPVECSSVEGHGLYFIYCIWVHGHKKGRGNFQKKGMGKALLLAAEEDAKSLGAKGMAAWGLAIPVFMRASWFRKHGYKKADKLGLQVLLWKPFIADARAPRWIKKKKRPEAAPERVAVTAFIDGWCPAMNMTVERAKRAASEFGSKVDFQAFRTLDRDTFLEWGISDALFINGKEIRTGPPPSFNKIRKKIARQVKKTFKS